MPNPWTTSRCDPLIPGNKVVDEKGQQEEEKNPTEENHC
jgi:hypothetical protein